MNRGHIQQHFEYSIQPAQESSHLLSCFLFNIYLPSPTVSKGLMRQNVHKRQAGSKPVSLNLEGHLSWKTFSFTQVASSEIAQKQSLHVSRKKHTKKYPTLLSMNAAR